MNNHPNQSSSFDLAILRTHYSPSKCSWNVAINGSSRAPNKSRCELTTKANNNNQFHLNEDKSTINSLYVPSRQWPTSIESKIATSLSNHKLMRSDQCRNSKTITSSQRTKRSRSKLGKYILIYFSIPKF